VAKGHVLPPPYVIKPIAEGSSVGVFIVREDHAHPPQELTRSDWPHGEEVLIERYIAGRELTCAVRGDEPLGIIEILPLQGLKFYDYEAKYADGGSIHVLPAKIPDQVTKEALSLAERAHAALGCRGVSRTDLRYDDTQSKHRLILLETNTQPGMTPTSLVPEQAAFKGFSYRALCRWMVEDASCDR